MNSTQQWQSVTWFEVDEHQAGQRIDNFLFSRLKGVPKSRIYRLIRESQVRVNKNVLKLRLNLRLVIRFVLLQFVTNKKTKQPLRSVTVWHKAY